MRRTTEVRLKHALESYRMLAATVGASRARSIARAEVVARVAAKLGGPAWPVVTAPSVDQLARSVTPTTAVTEVLGWAGVTDVEDLMDEFAEVSARLDRAYEVSELSCPEEWAVEAGTSAALYALVRSRRPEVVIETGIANGHSSFVILEAMRRNDRGRLMSIDVRHDVGRLVAPELAERWSKVIIDDVRPSVEILEERLGQIGPVGIVFHDGDHRFVGQWTDFRLASRLLVEGGLLVSDDVNTTSAWVDAAAQGLFVDGRILFDRRKAVGFAQLAR
jgi:predicted O-methyltransferase YrrM